MKDAQIYKRPESQLVEMVDSHDMKEPLATV